MVPGNRDRWSPHPPSRKATDGFGFPIAHARPEAESGVKPPHSKAGEDACKDGGQPPYSKGSRTLWGIFLLLASVLPFLLLYLF